MKAGWVALAALAVACGGSGGSSRGSDVPADTAPDVLAEVPVDVAADAAPDPSPDPVPEPQPETAPDPVPDVADVQVDVPADVPPDAPMPPPAVEWTVGPVATMPAFKSRAAIAVGPDGVPRVAYNVATSADRWDTPDVWLAELREGSWQHRLVAAADGISQEFPVLVVDSQGRELVFYNRFSPETGRIHIGGNAVDGVTPTDRDCWGPVVSIGPDDRVHVLFQERSGDPEFPVYSVGHVTFGSPAIGPEYHPIAEDTAQFSLGPDYGIVAGPGGTAQAVYSRPGDLGLNNVFWYRTFDGEAWGAEVRLTDPKLDAWSPAVALGPGGALDVVFTLGPDWDARTLHHLRVAHGAVALDQSLSSSVEDRSYYLGAVAGAGGLTEVAFTRFDGPNTDVRHLRLAADGTPGAEAAVTVTPDLDEWDPSMAVRASDGAPFLAFVENLSAAPDGTVYLARVVESEVPAIVAGVVAQAGIASVATDFPFEEVEAQSAGVRGVVPFGTALRAAVESFLADGTDEESPLALVAELTEGPCLQPDPLDRVKCYVDRPTSQLALVRADGTPQAAEHGEEVADAWIFWLYLPELSDHGHWAIVDRAGAAATYNYGFN